MDANHPDPAELDKIWAQVFDGVRQQAEDATVLLAMQVVKPLTIDGNFFIAGLPHGMEYMAINLQSAAAATAIEEALRAVTGRVLALRIIDGQTVEDWQRQKPAAGPTDAPPATGSPAPQPPVPPQPQAGSGTRTVYPTWEKLSERLLQGYKTAPLIRHPQGQARYIFECARMISDTMDVMMPAPGLPPDETQERMLAKIVERLGSVVNLDPLFISMEVVRYRQATGREPGGSS